MTKFSILVFSKEQFTAMNSEGLILACRSGIEGKKAAEGDLSTALSIKDGTRRGE